MTLLDTRSKTTRRATSSALACPVPNLDLHRGYGGLLTNALGPQLDRLARPRSYRGVRAGLDRSETTTKSSRLFVLVLVLVLWPSAASSPGYEGLDLTAV